MQTFLPEVPGSVHLGIVGIGSIVVEPNLDVTTG